ncbi:MAG: restriction endonuclease subunit S [Verrucomicrobiota bacterium]|jgi:type I restriction enzyme S subunit
MKYGLTEKAVEKICAVFARFPAIEKAVLYGSRAKGDFKTGSDIDLTLYGEALTADLRSAIASALDDLLLPYTIDLSIFDELNHAKLREHIERVGVLFYERANQGAAMKEGWQTKKLGELCEIELGKTPARANSAFWDEKRETGNVWLSIADLLKAEDNIVVDSKEYVSDKGAAICKLVPKGTLLVSFKLTLGRLAFAGRDLFTNEAIAALTIFNERELSKEFLFYFLHFFDWVKAAENDVKLKGMTLNKTKLKEMPVHFPSPDEQQRIVGILDEAFAGIATAKANAEKNLQNARALFDSHLQSVFTQRGEGWVEKPFSELCDIKHGFAFKSEFFASEGDYVLLTPGNFYESGGYRDRGEKQKYYTGEIPSDYILSEGDLLVAMTEQAAGLLGSPIIVPESDKFLHNQRLGLVTEKPGVAWTNEFFFHVFNTQSVRKQIHDNASGVKVRHTSPTKIGEVVVSFPTSLLEQREIVSKLKDLREETQRLASLYERTLAVLEALKKSLLHQAFTGEL